MDTVKIAPTENHTHTVVFLHGRGDRSITFAAALKYSTDSKGRSLFQLFPNFRWVFPEARVRPLAARPGRTWNQWFDILNAADRSEGEDLQREGLRESVTEIRQVLNREAAALNYSWDRIILAGISQGAVTSIHTLLNLDLPCGLGAFIGFSSRMHLSGRDLSDTRGRLGLGHTPTSDDVLGKTPVLLEHCVDDEVVGIEWGRALRDTLEAYGMCAIWKEYDRGGHWFNSPNGMDDVVEFLTSLGIQSVDGVQPDDGDAMDTT